MCSSLVGVVLFEDSSYPVIRAWIAPASLSSRPVAPCVVRSKSVRNEPRAGTVSHHRTTCHSIRRANFPFVCRENTQNFLVQLFNITLPDQRKWAEESNDRIQMICWLNRPGLSGFHVQWVWRGWQPHVYLLQICSMSYDQLQKYCFVSLNCYRWVVGYTYENKNRINMVW